MAGKKIDVDEFKKYTASIDIEVIRTISQNKTFTLEVISDNGFYVTPSISKLPRFVSNIEIEKFVNKYNEHNSFSPKDYLIESRNASYLLAILKNYLDSQNIRQSKEWDLGSSLLSTIEMEPLIDISEIFIDNIKELEVIKDIPIIKTVLSIFNSSIQISNLLFMKKVWSFLQQLQNIPRKQIDSFSKELKENYKFRQKVGQNIILYIERLNDMNKPAIFGKLFNAYIQGFYDYQMFIRLSRILEKFELEDEEILRSYYSTNKTEYESDDLNRLFIAGLLRPNLRFLAGEDVIGGYYKTELGKMFIKYALDPIK